MSDSPFLFCWGGPHPRLGGGRGYEEWEQSQALLDRQARVRSQSALGGQVIIRAFPGTFF